MGNITKISIDNVKHDIKDSVARSDIAYIKKELEGYQIDYSKQYLTIASLEDNNTISWKSTDLNNSSRKISVSTNNGLTWSDRWSTTSGSPLATLNNGEKLLIKGNNNAYGNGTNYNYFSSTKNFDIEGNIMSLIYEDNFVGKRTLTSSYNFTKLFYNCTNLKSAKNLILPATTLTSFCYSYMFASCTSLTIAPKLPATTLDRRCYERMFYYCTSLETAPELPAIFLAQECYSGMFNSCTALSYIKDLSTDALNYIKYISTDVSLHSSYIYINWTVNVSNNGIFIINDSKPEWPRGVSGIPEGWTVCTESEYKEVRHYELNNVPKVPKNIIFEDDGIYQIKDNEIYPVSHPDLSTQPSILPQRFGNLPIKEVLIANGREDEIPLDATIIEAFSFNNEACVPAICKKLTLKWNIFNIENIIPNFTLIKYIGLDKGYYYDNYKTTSSNSIHEYVEIAGI